MYPSAVFFAPPVGRTAAFCLRAFIGHGPSVTARDALRLLPPLRVQSFAIEHSPICLPSSIGSIHSSVLSAKCQLRNSILIGGHPVQPRARGCPSDGARRPCTERQSKPPQMSSISVSPARQLSCLRMAASPSGHWGCRRPQRTCDADPQRYRVDSMNEPNTLTQMVPTQLGWALEPGLEC